MPTYQFTDAESSQSELLPEGDYTFEVLAAESGIQGGTGKTKGSDYIELELQLNGGTLGRGLAFERLIMHAATAWKIDLFLKTTRWMKSDGRPPVKDEQLDIDPQSLIGLRGWCHVIIEEYMPTAKPGQPTPTLRKTNRVKSYLLNKGFLPRAITVAPEDPFAE